MGYDGLEVAPFTLASDPMDISEVQARDYARIAHDHGLSIYGLHWLLVAPAGLSLVSPDTAVRRRTTEVLCRLVELCELMGGSYLVHGSPKQRSVPEGETLEVAMARIRESLAQVAQVAEACGVTYCIEPLSHNETDVLNTVAQAATLVDEINSPAFKTMIDCSAAGQSEADSVGELMEKWMPTGRIGHVQVNDPNRRGPGQGRMVFKPILESLLRMRAAGHYNGIIAVEPFDYVPDGMGSAAHSLGYLRGVLQSIEN
ncbi:MAG: sugar phosphate isomerase/epimerase [Comamonadaceae bacterium]|nr:MAG: sugar phosphate isomerase/epimerase [Comamonadaceae bacterium]